MILLLIGVRMLIGPPVGVTTKTTAVSPEGSQTPGVEERIGRSLIGLVTGTGETQDAVDETEEIQKLLDRTRNHPENEKIQLLRRSPEAARDLLRKMIMPMMTTSKTCTGPLVNPPDARVDLAKEVFLMKTPTRTVLRSEEEIRDVLLRRKAIMMMMLPIPISRTLKL